MRIWILSDLHLELTCGWDLPSPADRPAFDVMIVAGDLIPRMQRGVAWLLERVPDRPVIYIAGNHEAYGQDIDIDLEIRVVDRQRQLELARPDAVAVRLAVKDRGALVADLHLGIDRHDARRDILEIQHHRRVRAVHLGALLVADEADREDERDRRQPATEERVARHAGFLPSAPENRSC